MKTLVIHPDDPTTTFLKEVYADLRNKTVITGGATTDQLLDLFCSHDRIMMMGHGSPQGLLSVGKFPGVGTYIINQATVPYLKYKENLLFIWCHADAFVRSTGLKGFATGMFISEEVEANAHGFRLWTQQSRVHESNALFSHIVRKHVNSDTRELHREVSQEYGRHARSNCIVRYNHQRLHVF